MPAVDDRPWLICPVGGDSPEGTGLCDERAHASAALSARNSLSVMPLRIAAEVVQGVGLLAGTTKALGSDFHDTLSSPFPALPSTRTAHVPGSRSVEVKRTSMLP